MFTHSKGDELVIPQETVLPLTARLRAVGANVHLTYFSHVEDLTGRYREADGSPKKTFNHGVWIHQFNDLCYQDFDGATYSSTASRWAAGSGRPEFRGNHPIGGPDL